MSDESIRMPDSNSCLKDVPLDLPNQFSDGMDM